MSNSISDRNGGSRRLVVDLVVPARVWTLPTTAAEQIRRAAPAGWEVRILTTVTTNEGDGADRPSDEAMTAIADAEIYFGYGVPRALFLAAPRLRWAHSAAAGVGSALFPEMLARDVMLTNSAGIHAVPIAEYVIGGVLYLMRGFDVAIASQRERRWDKSPFVNDPATVRELSDARVLIIGAGGLGGAIAKRLAGFGAHVTAIRRRPALGAPPGAAAVRGIDGLDEALGSAEVLILAAPLTAATRHLIDARRLALLPRGAIVVNVARGALLDEDALAARVRDGLLRGAVLDVFQREPLAADSPLWQLRSVLLTPHVSGVSPAGFWRRELELFLDNWRRYVAREPLRNVVDKQAGY